MIQFIARYYKLRIGCKMQKSKFKLNKCSENLRFALIVKNITQQQLADILGASQTCISRWINGSSSPSLDDVILLCHLLDEDPNSLLGFYEIDRKELDKYYNRLTD